MKYGLKMNIARWFYEATVYFVVSSIRDKLDHTSGWDFYWRVLWAFSSSATAQFTRSIFKLFCLPFLCAPSPSYWEMLCSKNSPYLKLHVSFPMERQSFANMTPAQS